MKWIEKVPTIAVLAAMLVSVNGRSPTRSFSLGATTLAGGCQREAPMRGAYKCPDKVGGERKW